ncbi:MAG: squalene synthase HpnC [Ectothiorhodospiraceae bacterium]|nr:squalene synthase HpnC [Ectothiorhodospiraceae bacterium]
MQESLSKSTKITLTEAYEHCINIAMSHYENFPVASRLMPREIRPSIAAVYAFARFADDIVDEGNLSSDERHRRLDAWREQLNTCTTDPRDPVFLALGDTITAYDLPLQDFHDLLDAFQQDIHKERYETFEEVLAYCERSANPVGRILLSLFRIRNSETVPPSDALCTALQLTNFWQDVSVDREKPRYYLPAEDMARFSVEIEELHRQSANTSVKNLIRFEVLRTREYFSDAESLFTHLPFRLRLEIKAVWHGGSRILDLIERQDFDILAQRPVLTKADWVSILLRSFF